MAEKTNTTTKTTDNEDIRVVYVNNETAMLIEELMTSTRQLNPKKLTDRKLRRTLPVLKSIIDELQALVAV